MKIATQLKCGVTSLAVLWAPYAYGQVMPAETAEAKKAAAQLSEPAGPPTPTLAPTSASDTPGQQTDRTTVPGYSSSTAVAANAANGQRGEIGVWLTENGGRGVRVGRIVRDGAADRAGIKNGDIILQVNGNGVASPSATAQQIRQVQVGQSAMLTVLRDGEQKQMLVTLMAARPGQQYVAGYGGDEGSNRNERSAIETDTGGLAARTSRLEQQVETMTEELRQIRQQISSMRASGTGTEPGSGLGTSPSVVSPLPSSSVTPPQAGSGTATPSSSATPISTPTSSTSPAAGGPSTPSARPVAGGSGSGDKDDLFGGSPPSSSSPSDGTSK